MENKSDKETIAQLVVLGYGQMVGSKMKLYKEKIKNKIKELDSLKMYKEVYDSARDKDHLVAIIIALTIANTVDEFGEFMANPKKMYTPESFELYIFILLFYDIDTPEFIDDEYCRFRLLGDIDYLIDRYEQVDLTPHKLMI
jgi:Na+-transporting methylmalonyl-CoA/oxaloacetate decarboxylase beta subunit